MMERRTFLTIEPAWYVDVCGQRHHQREGESKRVRERLRESEKEKAKEN